MVFQRQLEGDKYITSFLSPYRPTRTPPPLHGGCNLRKGTPRLCLVAAAVDPRTKDLHGLDWMTTRRERFGPLLLRRWHAFRPKTNSLLTLCNNRRVLKQRV